MITVAIPVFNDRVNLEDTIVSVIEGLKHIEGSKLLISDDWSTDGSSTLCESLVSKFEVNLNIEYRKTPCRLGGASNHRFLLSLNDSKYFMWMGQHDLVSTTYFSRALQFLESNQDYAAFVAEHVAINEAGQVIPANHVNYNFYENDEPILRFLISAAELSNCYLFHSVFRASALEHFCFTGCPSEDHPIISCMAYSGKFKASAETQFFRRYFSREKRDEKLRAGHYVSSVNNTDFFRSYFLNFENIMLRRGLKEEERVPLRAQLLKLLTTRFGDFPSTEAS